MASSRPPTEYVTDQLLDIFHKYSKRSSDHLIDPQGIEALRSDLKAMKQSNFADFYAYAFNYSLTEEQESIDRETACEFLDIVMGSRFRPQVDYFVEYLKIQNDYKVINMDQWMGFYRFCNEISFPGMTEYNPELGWPLLLNNFVEWIREKKA